MHPAAAHGQGLKAQKQTRRSPALSFPPSAGHRAVWVVHGQVDALWSAGVSAARALCPVWGLSIFPSAAGAIIPGPARRNGWPHAWTQQQRRWDEGCSRRLGRDIMHPMFVKLFIEGDADDLPPEEDWRRRARRSRRARPAMVVRPAAGGRHTRRGGDR